MAEKNVDTNVCGVVLVNKKAGISSNKVVNIVKAKLYAKKCGHLGTLDLEGEGLLLVTVNSATKLFDFFLQKEKTYETIFVFGFETDTLDASGQIVKQKECEITKDQIEKHLFSMVGKQMQMPPLYSAKKVNGKVGYKEARKGNTMELSPKEIQIFDIKLLEEIGKNTFKFEISCSSGTYIRSVCRDLAEKLGTYGTMQCITRTTSGVFCLKDANSMEDIENGKINIVHCDVLFDFPKMEILQEEKDRLFNGQFLENYSLSGQYKLYCNNMFLGIGEIENHLLKLKLRLL